MGPFVTTYECDTRSVSGVGYYAGYGCHWQLTTAGQGALRRLLPWLPITAAGLTYRTLAQAHGLGGQPLFYLVAYSGVNRTPGLFYLDVTIVI